MNRVLRIGTRASALATWQTGRVAAAIEASGCATETILIHTSGDLSPEVPMSQLNDPALFTRQLDEAMAEGRIDLAVHSLKDLPTEFPPGIVLAAVSAREDARDALITRDGGGFASLPANARVATSSVRRRAQLLRARPDLEVVETRGNVDTRLGKLDRDSRLHATMLATAGLVRLGLASRISERLPFALMLPAPGQAALAVTARADDPDALAVARAAVHNPRTAMAVGAERAVLQGLGGGCDVPVGAFGEWSGESLRLWARVVSLDGRTTVEAERTGVITSEAEAEAMGRELAQWLTLNGARPILDECICPADRA